MSNEVLENFVRQHIESQDIPEIEFAWQGGEPTLMGREFFGKCIALQKKYANGKRIRNAFQTNGTLLDEKWAAFLARHRFLVGISIDGPRELHDAYRVDCGGRSSFDRVMKGLCLLSRHGVNFNTLTTVQRANSARPLEVYKFLVEEAGSRFLQFIPIVERQAAGSTRGMPLAHPIDDDPGIKITDWSVAPLAYGKFLAAIFDHWVHHDVGRIFIQMFDVALGSWAGAPGTLCEFSETCGEAVALEHNGDVFSCDHFVYADHRIGNISVRPLRDIVESPAQLAFGAAKRDALPAECGACAYRFACHGGCPKNRFLPAADGSLTLNYLCEGYRHFFAHVDPYMRIMADRLRARQPAADIMPMLRRREAAKRPLLNFSTGIPATMPCPCRSGKPFASCCGA